MGGSESSDPPFLANGAPECRKTNDTSYASVGRKPARKRGTRLPSGACTGLTFSPATSAERIVAPAGKSIFRYDFAWFLTVSLTSVSERPSDVTIVVTTARSARAASTALSGKRTQSSAKVGASLGWRWKRKAACSGKRESERK